MKTKTKRGYFGLDYVVLVNVPVRETEHGEVIDVPSARLARRVCEELIRQRAPIRGRELMFLRKEICQCSYEKFGAMVGCAGTTVYKWEKATDERLDSFTEIALRAFFAEKLGVNLRGWFHEMKAAQDEPSEINVDLKAA